MNGMTKKRRSASSIAAWAVLIGMGGTSVTFQVWHAVHAGVMPLGLALLTAGAPVGAAMGLSEIVAVHKSGWLLKSITVAVMLGAMGLSAGAIAAVVAPVEPHESWLFGAVLDAAALVALATILTERERRAKEQAEAEAEAARLAAEQEARRDLLRHEPVPEPVSRPRPKGRPAPRQARPAGDAQARVLRAWEALGATATNDQLAAHAQVSKRTVQRYKPQEPVLNGTGGRS